MKEKEKTGVGEMSEALKLPVGIENFREIRENGFYYIDKTKLIEQLLERFIKINHTDIM